MAGDTVSYLDAWSLWLEGIDVRRHVLWGVEIFWWGRFASVAALSAGIIIFLDVIDYGRLRALLHSSQERIDKVANLIRFTVVAAVVIFFVAALVNIWAKQGWGSAVFALLSVVAIYQALIWLNSRYESRLLALAARMLSPYGISRAARTVSFFMLIAAFHFHLLAS
jgi:hypothetical protein